MKMSNGEHMADVADILGRIHARADRLEGECLSRFGFALCAVGAAIYGQAKGVDASREMLVSLAECSGEAQAEGADSNRNAKHPL